MLLETANYRDLVILDGGLRFDDYDHHAGKLGFSDLRHRPAWWNLQCRRRGQAATDCQRLCGLRDALRSGRRRTRRHSTAYGGLNPWWPINQIFGPVKNKADEVGTKWELLDRHLLPTGALFRTDDSNARELVPAGSAERRHHPGWRAYHVQGIDLGATGKITEN